MTRLRRLYCSLFHASPASIMYCGGHEWECRRCGLRGEVAQRNGPLIPWVSRGSVRQVEAPKPRTKVRPIERKA